MTKPDVISGLDNKQKVHQTITISDQKDDSNALEHLPQDENDDKQKTLLKNSDQGKSGKSIEKSTRIKKSVDSRLCNT